MIAVVAIVTVLHIFILSVFYKKENALKNRTQMLRGTTCIEGIAPHFIIPVRGANGGVYTACAVLPTARGRQPHKAIWSLHQPLLL